VIRASLFGLPTAGKSTVSFIVAKRLGIGQVNVGELLRRCDVEAARRGVLADDGEVIAIVSRVIERCRNGFLLDGFPRTDAQMAFIDASERAACCRFILLDLDAERVRQRFLDRSNCPRCCRAEYRGSWVRHCSKCGGPLIRRADSTEAALACKLAEFNREELPLIERLDAEKRLERLRVEGEPEVDSDRLIDILTRGENDVSR
jgi:adenylate kinase